MTAFDEMKLRRLDLTLLLVFLALLRTGKAATVAREMGMTPSAVSHALSRLRGVFGDPLFLRRPHGLDPTSFALSLEPGIRGAVEALDGSLRGTAPLDPARVETTIRLSALDYEVATLLPGLVARAAAEMPGLRLSIRSPARREAMAALASSALDLALGYFPAPGPEMIHEPLFDEGYMVVAARGHPALRQGLTLEDYVAARHLVTSPKGDLGGIVDAALARMGLRRQVVAAVPQFLPAMALAAASDLLVTVPSRMARLDTAFGLDRAEAPLPLRRFTVGALRHRRDARNGLLDWVVAALAEGD